jgi:ABC-type multidrug transport system ATPase subunit
MTAITTNNLTKTFGGLAAVNGLNLSVAKGELFGLIGSDGAGTLSTGWKQRLALGCAILHEPLIVWDQSGTPASRELVLGKLIP